MYHYVREIKNSKYPNIKGLEFKEFKKQINYFIKNFNILSNDDIIEILNTKKLPKKKSILLTFDDGYIDHWKYVYPFLKEKKITGNFYVPTNTIKKSQILDVNKIHFILEREDNKLKIIDFIFDNLNKKILKKINLKDIDKINILNRYDDVNTVKIKKILQIFLPDHTKKKIINLLFNKYVKINKKNFAKELYMSSDHLVQMYKDRMHIGSHGCNHYWMNKLDYKKQYKEIKTSLNFFKKIGVYNNNFSFCYPYGGFNSDTLKILKEFNFKYALTTIVDSLNKKNIKNNFLIPRYDTNDLLNFN